MALEYFMETDKGWRFIYLLHVVCLVGVTSIHYDWRRGISNIIWIKLEQNLSISWLMYTFFFWYKIWWYPLPQPLALNSVSNIDVWSNIPSWCLYSIFRFVKTELTLLAVITNTSVTYSTCFPTFSLSKNKVPVKSTFIAYVECRLPTMLMVSSFKMGIAVVILLGPSVPSLESCWFCWLVCFEELYGVNAKSPCLLWYNFECIDFKQDCLHFCLNPFFWGVFVCSKHFLVACD